MALGIRKVLEINSQCPITFRKKSEKLWIDWTNGLGFDKFYLIMPNLKER